MLAIYVQSRRGEGRTVKRIGGTKETQDNNEMLKNSRRI
jgi:hypothetical protein